MDLPSDVYKEAYIGNSWSLKNDFCTLVSSIYQKHGALFCTSQAVALIVGKNHFSWESSWWMISQTSNWKSIERALPATFSKILELVIWRMDFNTCFHKKIEEQKKKDQLQNFQRFSEKNNLLYSKRENGCKSINFKIVTGFQTDDWNCCLPFRSTFNCQLLEYKFPIVAIFPEGSIFYRNILWKKLPAPFAPGISAFSGTSGRNNVHKVWNLKGDWNYAWDPGLMARFKRLSRSFFPLSANIYARRD